MRRTVFVAALLTGLAAVGIYLLATRVGGYFWHPLSTGTGTTCSATSHSGCGYSFWSGGASDIAEVTLIFSLGAFLGAWWRKHNCHVQRCWRLQWHQHPGHGHPVCALHHPYGQGRGDHLHPRHHTRDAHLGWPSLRGEPFPQMWGGATTASGYIVNENTSGGPVEPEPAKRKPRKPRERKPGTQDVTEIKPKQNKDG